MQEGIVIAGASCRAAASSALRANLTPYAADLFGDSDLRELASVATIEKYPHEFVATVRDFPDAPWMYTGGLENYPQIVAEISRTRTLWGNNAAALQEVRHPWCVHAALKNAGLPALAVSDDPPTDARQWVRKPLRSSGGSGVRMAILQERRHGDCYFQEYKPGAPTSGVFVASQGNATILGVTQQIVGDDWTGAKNFQYAGSIGPCCNTLSVEAQWRKIGQTLARQFQLTGLFGVDAILADDGLWVVEVNPRYTASVEILERAMNFSAIELHRRACNGETIEFDYRKNLSNASSRVVWGKAIVFAERHFEVNEALFQWMQAFRKAEPPLVADVPKIGARIQAGAPVATVFASALQFDDVRGVLRENAFALRRCFPA